jgi:hypothetical protein
MKTRVTEHWDGRFGHALYWVQGFTQWQAEDLRAAYPNEVDWRYLSCTTDREEAIRRAKAISEGAPIEETVIVAEFGA